MTESGKLAYVFWHRPDPGVSGTEYERDLLAFHGVLKRHPTPGLLGSAAFRLAALPWVDAGPAPGYEDWYSVTDWAGIGELNAGAVTGARRAAHDRVATLAGFGAGAVYGLRGGGLAMQDVRFAFWFGKPSAMSYAQLDELVGEHLAAAGRALWQRQLVLGPAPEFCLLAAAPVDPPGRLDGVATAVAPVSSW